jgi:hypothetical protein
MSPVGARAGVQPAQLNGKQKEVTLDVWQPNLRCPRNGTADEALISIERFGDCAHTTGGDSLWEGTQALLRQPGYRPTRRRAA